jgi:hypothetical protein
VQFRYELATNDPDLPLITLTVAALVKPIPQSVRRIENADVIKGEWFGTFKVWPTAHPQMTLARGEALSFSLRIWPDQPDRAHAAGLNSPSVGPSQAQDAANPADTRKIAPLPPGTLTTTIRQEDAGQTYWLDVKIGPVGSSGSFRSPIVIPAGHSKLSGLSSLDVLVVVRADN